MGFYAPEDRNRKVFMRSQLLSTPLVDPQMGDAFSSTIFFLLCEVFDLKCPVYSDN